MDVTLGDIADALDDPVALDSLRAQGATDESIAWVKQHFSALTPPVEAKSLFRQRR